MAKDTSPMATRKPRLSRVVARSTTSATNLVVGGAAALGAAVLHSWPLLLLGGAAYATLVAWDVASPRFWQKASGGPKSPPPLELPDPARLNDPDTRGAVVAMVAARDRLGRALADTPDTIKSHLGEVLGMVTELEQHAARLALRAEDLGGYLATTDAGAVRASVARLGEQARGARDDETRGEYERARAAHEEHLAALGEVEAAHERILANLARLVANLEVLPVKLVRMRALDAQAVDAMSGDLHGELDRLTVEIKSFEETLETLAEVAR